MEPPTQDRLQEIRGIDAMAGEDLQFCPATWKHRRELLAYIDMLVSGRENDALAITALSHMLEPYSGGTSDIHELVDRIQHVVTRQPVAGPVEPGACCSNERRNMNGGCDSCGAPCL